MYEEVISEFRRCLEPIDFSDLFYVNLPKQGIRSSHNGAIMTDRKIGMQMLKYPVLATTETVRRMFATQRQIALRDISRVPDYYLLGRWPKGYYLGPFTKCEEERLISNQKNGINGEASYYCSFEDDEFVGMFHFCSRLPQKELEAKLENKLVAQCLELSHFYLTRMFPSLTNPNVFNGKIGDRTLEVLELSSQGFSSKDIASSLYISERGVIYHLDKARVSLSAQNKVDLIRKAKEYCII